MQWLLKKRETMPLDYTLKNGTKKKYYICEVQISIQLKNRNMHDKAKQSSKT